MDNAIEVGHVSTQDQIADILTKPLAESRFLLLRDKPKTER